MSHITRKVSLQGTDARQNRSLQEMVMAAIRKKAAIIRSYQNLLTNVIQIWFFGLYLSWHVTGHRNNLKLKQSRTLEGQQSKWGKQIIYTTEIYNFENTWLIASFFLYWQLLVAYELILLLEYLEKKLLTFNFSWYFGQFDLTATTMWNNLL